MGKYLNQKGSTLILVLSSLIILLAISTVVIVLSVASMGMSRKFSDWSKEYYRLDYAVEKRIGELDRGALVAAEDVSWYYLQNNYYQYPSINDFPPPADCMPVDVRNAFLSFPELQILLNNRWVEIMSILDIKYENQGETEHPPFDELRVKYDTEMEEFLPKVFDVVYCACLNSNLNNITSTSNITSLPGIDSSVNINKTHWFPTINPFDSFDSFYNKIGEIPKIQVLAWENSTFEPKQIVAELEIISPCLDVVYQTRHYAEHNPAATEDKDKYNSESSCATGLFTLPRECSVNTLGLESYTTTVGEINNGGIYRYIINSWRLKKLMNSDLTA